MTFSLENRGRYFSSSFRLYLDESGPYNVNFPIGMDNDYIIFSPKFTNQGHRDTASALWLFLMDDFPIVVCLVLRDFKEGQNFLKNGFVLIRFHS